MRREWNMLGNTRGPNAAYTTSTPSEKAMPHERTPELRRSVIRVTPNGSVDVAKHADDQ